MREIKFRAWVVKHNMMIEVDILNLRHKCVTFFYPRVTGLGGLSADNQSIWAMDKEIIVMQYAGLKDKNGKEIYEGDINMDDDNRRSEVVFYAGGFYFKYSITEYKSIGSFAPFNYMVIGNIYENPELLRETNGEK